METYNYLDEALIAQILEIEPSQVDLIRACLALGLTRRRLGAFVGVPSEHRSVNAKNAATRCELLKTHLNLLFSLSPFGKTPEEYLDLLHSYGVDIYISAAQIAFLLSLEESI